ncbi:tryptophan tryptophylquinone biosynthesis enzyme MauG [Bordetella trematum]|nr:tryptophan tryptophylquinone biosynthesis enzyme MauG [Bordetella trematum]
MGSHPPIGRCPQLAARQCRALPLARDIARPEIRALGARLFAEPRLSRSGRIACASCHQPQRALGDGRPLAVGEDGLMGRRRSMPLYGAPFAPCCSGMDAPMTCGNKS